MNREIFFASFRLDIAGECVWRGTEAITLRPKAFAVLRALVERAGRLVTKEELLRAVWPDTFADEAALRGCIREIRKKLGDQPSAPHLIETARRRGYRFIGKISDQQPADSGPQLSGDQAQAVHSGRRRFAPQEAIEGLTRALDLAERLTGAERSEAKIRALRQRGMIYRAQGRFTEAADDFTALLWCAREAALAEEMVKGLLDLSSILFWLDHKRCLAAARRAVELSRQLQDDTLRAHAAGHYAHWKLQLRGWQDEDFQAVEQAINVARATENRWMLGRYLVSAAQHRGARSDYRGAMRAAEEAVRLTAELGDAYLHLAAQFLWARAGLHLGHWGKALRLLSKGARLAGRGGNQLGQAHFQIGMAWLYKESFDFTKARELCEPVLRREQQTGYGKSVFILCLLLLGHAHLGLNRDEEAFQCFSDSIRRLDDRQVMIDPAMRFLLHQGLGEYWLAQGAADLARREAEELCELAFWPGERTYLALGRRALAEIAMVEEDWDRAEMELRRALAALAGGNVPLAEWRVCQTAAAFYERQGHRDKARRFWAQSAEIINQLAGSLGDHARLRTSFLAAPPVRASLDRARLSLKAGR